MASTPRYVPTLTEVVVPARAPERPVAPVTTSKVPKVPVGVAATRLSRESMVDSQVLVQNAIKGLRPQLEAHLRRSAEELLEMHVREVLPALQKALEAEVRRAVEESLAERLADT